MPAQEDLEITAEDGFTLSARLYAPGPEVRGSVLMNPATGVRKEYYQPFAEFLATRGWRVLTFDNRGVGSSRPASLRGFAARMQDWAELDSEAALRRLIDEADGEPGSLCLVGHSFGGQGLGLFPTARRLDAALLVATQSGYWGHWSWWQRPRVTALWFVAIPLVTAALGYFPARRLGLGEDLPAGVARQWARWGRHRDYLMRDATPSWREGYEALTLPIRGIGFTDDVYAPRRSMAAILALYANARVDHRHLAPRARSRVGRALRFLSQSAAGAILWEPAAAWLESHWVSSRGVSRLRAARTEGPAGEP